jgi:hypothetical protein
VVAYLLHDHHGWWKCNRVAGATLAHAVVVASIHQDDKKGALFFVIRAD